MTVSEAHWTDRVLAARPVWSRAPSAHNTQPGRIERDGDGLTLTWDPERELTVTDPTRRDHWLSLGALVEAVLIAAADLGLALDAEWDIDTRAHRAGRITLADRPAPTRLTFRSADVLNRRTARGPYGAPLTTEAELVTIAATAEIEDGDLTLLPPRLVGKLLPRADRWTYSSPAQVAELRQWLRLDPDDAAYGRDGLTDEALALTSAQSRALRVALQPRVWRALSHVGGPTLMAAAAKQKGRGSVVAFHVPEPVAQEPALVCASGQALFRCWLAATHMSLRTHPLSQLIDAPATAPQLASQVSNGDPRAVLSVFRIGHPVSTPPRSARL